MKNLLIEIMDDEVICSMLFDNPDEAFEEATRRAMDNLYISREQIERMLQSDNKILGVSWEIHLSRIETPDPANEPSRLKHELDMALAREAAVMYFLEVEMGWEFFRSEMGIGKNPPVSLQNAEKLRKFLEAHKSPPPLVRSSVEAGKKLRNQQKKQHEHTQEEGADRATRSGE